jgi:heme/copper-type cytochrome/quinol oxidase subunit 1
VTTLQQAPAAGVTPRAQRKGSILAGWLSSTDHEVMGHMYLITSFFFLCAGVMAMLIRIQLLGPDQHFVSDQQYNELFTMHGTIMLLLFATPLFTGFANELLPLQIGAPDVAFPRLNLLSYYMFKGMVAAMVAIAGLSMTVWAHHMFTAGAVLLPFVSFMSLLIAIPTGIKSARRSPSRRGTRRSGRRTCLRPAIPARTARR